MEAGKVNLKFMCRCRGSRFLTDLPRHGYYIHVPCPQPRLSMAICETRKHGGYLAELEPMLGRLVIQRGLPVPVHCAGMASAAIVLGEEVLGISLARSAAIARCIRDC